MESSIVKYSKFDYFYMFVICLYMASVDIHMRAMETFSSRMSSFAILLPIFLTVILSIKYRVSFKNEYLVRILLFVFIWSLIQLIKFGFSGASLLPYVFYFIIVSYVHYAAFGKKVFLIFEKILVKLSKLSLILWGIGVLMPGFAILIYHLMPGYDTGSYGDNFFYIFNWMNPAKGQVIEGTLISRNAGFSWEPGRFSIMLILAITINLLHEGLKFRKNKNLCWLTIALVTTFSTTGYCAYAIIVSYFFIKRFTLKNIFGYILIIVPCFLLSSEVNFLGDKIDRQIAESFTLEKYQNSLMNAEKTGSDYAFSLERFPSMIFEYENIKHEPIFGYGLAHTNSYYNKEISNNSILTGGFLKVIAQYGLILGLFFYWCLYKSSVKISSEFCSSKKYALLICYIVCSISYPIMGVALFTTFWLYGFFSNTEMQN